MYEELVKKLRYCGNAVSCLHCPYWEGCAGSKEDLTEAADAIENLSAAVSHGRGVDVFARTVWATEGGDMMEVKIVMDDYGLLFAILPDGSKRAIRADIFGYPYYGVVEVSEEPKKES